MKILIRFYQLLIISLVCSTAFGQAYNMDVNGGAIGTGTTINTCSGTISEGAGNYANNDYFQITFCAPVGQAVQLNFTSWSVETCCDYLTVYDGSTNAGTQLFYGNGSSTPGIITGTGQCITLTWDTDASVTYAGWQATITCYTPGTCSDGVQNQDETGIDCGGTYCIPCSCLNGIQDAGETGVDCGTVCGLPCPCGITATPTPTILPCGGGLVSIAALGQGSTSYALNNDFQTGAGNGWSVSPAGQFDNPCDPSVDGGTYMWMGNTTAAPRTLETTALDVSCGGDICFFLDFATQGGASPCEGPDLTNEGVYLEYSIDGGVTWVTINYFQPNLNGVAGTITTWNQYCFPIPLAAQTATTLFHWFQNGSSGTCCDHWGIDNVTISSQSCNPYVYDWTQFPVGSTFINDSTISSNITITTDFTVCYTNNVDDTCCTTLTVIVGALDPIIVNGTPEVCLNASDGTITVSPATGGTAPYTYDITGPVTLTQVSNGSFTGLPPGTYNVTVTDNAGCQAFGSFIVLPGIVCCPMTNTETFTNITCFGANDGTITLTENLGAVPVTFSIDNGVTTQPTGIFTGLLPATYQIVITDGNGCQYLSTIEMIEPPIVTITPTIIDATCGLANGQITLVGGGGSLSGYTYSIDGGVTFQSNGAFAGLSPGSYTVAVMDGTGCVITMVVTIANLPVPVIDNIVITEPLCLASCDGTISVTASGGVGVLQYSIDGGTTFQAGGLFTGQCAGTYNIVVEDANLCQVTGTTTLTDPTAIAYTVTPTNLNCFSVCIGQLDVLSVTGGNGVYQYSNDNGVTFQAGNSFASLCAANYTVVVQDGNGCQTSSVETITEPTLLTLANTFTDPLCAASCDGTITLTESGGTSSYQYSTDNGITFVASGAFTSICAGTYNLVVQDLNGCQAISTATLTDPPVVTITPAVVDATCGLSNGQITLVGGGGSGAGYTYSIDGGTTFQASGSFTALLAGNYNVVVMDGAGCQMTMVVTINNGGAPTINNVAFTDPTCDGLCDGTITITASGGTGTLQYSVDNGVTYQVGNGFTGLCGNNYDIAVIDALGCPALSSAILTTPAPVVFDTNMTNLLCNAVCTGQIDIVTVTGGDGAYQYSNDNGVTFQAGNSFASLCAAGYSLVVQDGNLCQATMGVTVTEPPLLTTANIFTDPLCAGVCDGTITLTEGGGVGPYLYSIDNGVTIATTGIFTNVCAGTHNLLIQDANGCQITSQVILTDPAAVTFVPTLTGATCGLPNGIIDIVASGGDGNYTYSNDNGVTFQAGSSFPNLLAGNYNVVVMDGNACSSTLLVTIANLGAPLIDSVIITEPLCLGVCDGTINIFASAGAGGYQYSIDGGVTFQAGGAFTGQCSGIYNIIVEDANLCQVMGTTTLTDPAALTYSVTPTNLDCFGVCIGQLDILSVTGGNGVYQYSNDNGTTFQAGNTFPNLCANSYSVIVQDGNGCQGSSTETITEPALLTIVSTFTDPLCVGACNGTITLTGTGGTGSYQYSIDNGITFIASGSFTGVCAGTYDIVIEDSNGCQAANQVVLADPVPVTFVPTPTDATCGLPNGIIDIVASGGDGNYTYSNDNGVTSQAGSSFPNLFAGNYNVVVTDGNGCADTMVAIIIDLPMPLLDSIVITEPLCPGVCDGTINVFASAGAGGFQYSIDNGVTFQAGGMFTGQCSGTYNIVIEDANLCQVAGTTTLTDPIALTYSVTPTNLDCFGVCIGQLDILSVTGGDGVYQYSNDNGVTYQAGNTFSSLCANSYNVVVQDGNGCQANSVEVITEPSIVAFTFTTIDNNCNQLNAACDGQITVTATGGTGAYQYSVDNGVTFVAGNIFTDLCAGTYNVVVADVNNCQATQIVTINEPTFLDFTSATVLTSCGSANGEITLTGQGGTGTYQYSIDNGATYQAGANFTGLLAGAYNSCVMDANGCTFCNAVNVNNNSGQTITNIAFTEPTCNGSCDGTITTTVTGGAAPIQYSLDGGAFQVSNLFTAVCGGVHTITTQDNNLCQAGQNVTLTDPGVMAYVPVITNLDCFQQCIGVIDFTNSSGGDGAYQYSIDGGATFQAATSFTGLCAGTYNLVIQDGNLCSASSTETVTEPTLLTLVFSTVDASCFGYCDGSANAMVSGGTTPYDYQWSGGIAPNTDPNAINLCANPYDLIVSDANGCQVDTMQFVIGEPVIFVINASNTTNELCNGDCLGEIDIDAPGAVSYSIDNNSTSQGTQLFTNLCAGTYAIYAANAAGCVATSTATLVAPALLTITEDPDATICIGESISICGTATGGTGAYIFNWDIPATGQCQTVSPTTATSYSVSVTDANGCTAPPRTITITVNPPLQVVVYQDAIICPGDTSQIEAGAMGGNGGPYTYYWINDQNSNILNGELHLVHPDVTTVYTAIVTDNCGTPADSAFVTITILPLPQLDWDHSPLSGCDPLLVSFTNQTTGTISGNCQWDFGDGVISNSCDASHTYSPGCYDVTFAVYSPEGCKSDTVLYNYVCVSEIPVPDFTFGPQPTTILEPFIDFTNASTGAFSYYWDFGFDGETSTEIDPQNITFPDVDPGTYNVCLTATSSAGCDSTTCYNVIINDEFLFYVPNAFTPDGDGVNDVFLPQTRGYDPLSYELLIFNRWGELIFESNFPTNGWDGYYKGTLSQTDVYVWKIKIKDKVSREQKSYIGHVTLLR